MVKKCFLILLFVVAVSCNQKSQTEKEIENVDVELDVVRFDKRLADAEPGDIPQLKQEFPYLFPAQYPDSLWAARLTDSIQVELLEEVGKKFSSFSEHEDQLHDLFQHIKYYFPETKVPKVVTVISEVDYENKVIAADSLLLISLDTYLGEDHHFYMGMQSYLKKNFEPSQIAPDVANAYAQQLVPRPQSRTLLAQMVYYGKLLYLKDILLPAVPNEDKIGYTEEELQWARANEEEIWRYFVDREMLFKTNSELYSRFLYPGPFTKFNLELDHESPDRLGQYIGWQMVRRYMQENNIDVRQLIFADAETIFRNANYKPSR